MIESDDSKAEREILTLVRRTGHVARQCEGFMLRWPAVDQDESRDEDDDSQDRHRQEPGGPRRGVVDARCDPARATSTDPITAVVSGATLIAIPTPSTTTAGKKVVQ